MFSFCFQIGHVIKILNRNLTRCKLLVEVRPLCKIFDSKGKNFAKLSLKKLTDCKIFDLKSDKLQSIWFKIWHVVTYCLKIYLNASILMWNLTLSKNFDSDSDKLKIFDSKTHNCKILVESLRLSKNIDSKSKIVLKLTFWNPTQCNYSDLKTNTL